VFLDPVVLFRKDCKPLAVFSCPVVFNNSAWKTGCCIKNFLKYYYSAKSTNSSVGRTRCIRFQAYVPYSCIQIAGCVVHHRFVPSAVLLAAAFK
jgi:hypothetical protein